MADPVNPFAGATMADFQPTDESGNVIVKKAQPVQQDVAKIVPDMNVHDPVTYGSLTADHMLRERHAQGLDMNQEQYDALAQKAMSDAISYQAGRQKTAYEKQLEEAYKVLEAQPGGLETQKAAIAAQSAQTQKQEEQGPSATALAIKEGVFPGQGKVSALISAPKDQQQKDWAAYTEGFHNLQDMHTLFDNMATKTFGAGGPLQSAAGLTSHIVNLTSPEGRLYHSYVESSLVPLAKSIMGDAATTAGKDTIQAALQDAFPNVSDTGVTGGQKMFMFYRRALDKMQVERDLARKNGVDTTSIDTTLNDFHSFVDSPAVQKYNPLHNQNQPLVGQGNSPQAQQQVANAIYNGTGKTAPNIAQPNWWTQGNPNQFQGMQASGSGTQLLPTPPNVSPAAQQQRAAQEAQASQIGQGLAQRAAQTTQEVTAGPKTIWDWLQPFQTSPQGNVQFPGQQ